MILVLREEIVCLAILAFLIFYYQINKVKDNSTVFLKLCSYGMLHLIFDIVTVITVNNQDIVPELLNRVCHIAFYFSGILFSVGLYNYVIDLLGIYKYRKVLKIVEYVPFAIFCISLAFLPMEYKMGDGTWYSFGPLAVMGYGLFLLYCGICLILLIVERKRLDERVRHALIPIIIVMYFAIDSNNSISKNIIFLAVTTQNLSLHNYQSQICYKMRMGTSLLNTSIILYLMSH